MERTVHIDVLSVFLHFYVIGNTAMPFYTFYSFAGICPPNLSVHGNKSILKLRVVSLNIV